MMDGDGPRASDVDVRGIVKFAAALVVAAAAVHVALWLFLRGVEGRQARRDRPPAPMAAAPGAPERVPERMPEPRLRTAPSDDLARMRAREEALLGSYGWVDRKRGIARIPVERAIEVLAERGLPARPATDRSGK